ncbi:MAG: hypothetical protein HYR94_04715 [Chloroflexi bacterium]|nr:hypothetical protein [Chloroflexota bacterium]
MMNSTQLIINFQDVCATRLTTWQKHRKNALYRHTEDFVQWLLFDKSSSDVSIIPHYSVQLLATQFPSVDLTLGDRVRGERGNDLWITLDDWKMRKDEIVEQIIQQVKPSAIEPLTTRAIREFLTGFPSKHEAAITARGIVAIVAGDTEEGYHYLKQALNKYTNIPYPWARVEEIRLNDWLSCTPEDIVPILRKQAEIGAKLLNLKD